MEERKKIGIIAAMSCEIDILKAELEEPQVKIIAGTEFHYGRIGKYDVGFLLCGMGKVGAAIGHVCQQNKVPFCVIRCMSDNANGDSGVNFAEFAPMAGEKSAKYLLEFLQQD